MLEVLVSMGVFSLLMLALMQFFSAAQGVWERTGNKAELFESAKTAMDILANDLACAYYEQDHDPAYLFFNISSTDSSQVVFAAQKEDGNAQIFYKWDNTAGKIHRVERKESDVFTSGTVTPSNWFTRSGTGWIASMSGTALTDGEGKNPYCLAENVLDFSITAHKKNALTTPLTISSATADKFPDTVIVSMTVLSNDAHEKLLVRFAAETDKEAAIRTLFNTTTFRYIKADGSESGESETATIRQMLTANTPPSGGDETNQAILFNGCQRFTCVIPLNRGQNK